MLWKAHQHTGINCKFPSPSSCFSSLVSSEVLITCISCAQNPGCFLLQVHFSLLSWAFTDNCRKRGCISPIGVHKETDPCFSALTPPSEAQAGCIPEVIWLCKPNTVPGWICHVATAVLGQPRVQQSRLTSTTNIWFEKKHKWFLKVPPYLQGTRKLMLHWCFEAHSPGSAQPTPCTGAHRGSIMSYLFAHSYTL